MSWIKRGKGSQQKPWSGQICLPDHQVSQWYPPVDAKQRIPFSVPIIWQGVVSPDVQWANESCMCLCFRTKITEIPSRYCWWKSISEYNMWMHHQHIKTESKWLLFQCNVYCLKLCRIILEKCEQTKYYLGTSSLWCCTENQVKKMDAWNI